jgi:hypothetical protein
MLRPSIQRIRSVGRYVPFPIRRPRPLDPLTQLARLWPVVRTLWLLAAGTSGAAVLLLLLVAPASGAARALRAWTTVLPTLGRHPYLLSEGALWLLLSLVTFAAFRLRSAGVERDMASYLVQPVRRLDPSAFVPHYVPEVYLTRRDRQTGRSLDVEARQALRAAAARHISATAHPPLGICVFGRPLQGKTRLAWEAVRTTLPTWTLVRWRHTLRPPSLTSLPTRHIVLWLDDLHEYANPNEAHTLDDLPYRCAQAGVHLVVVATCREGEEETRASRYLESLLERLTPIRLGALDASESEQLAAALAKRGMPVEAARSVRSPGALVLNVSGMRRDRYPHLPDDAQCVLRALKLLRSARIFTYPERRVLATAVNVFGLPAVRWESACQSLVAAGLITLTPPSPTTGERQLELVAGAYLDEAVPDYLTPDANPSDDWPWLFDSLERHDDAEGLLTLGSTYMELRSLLGVFLPADPQSVRLQAVMCCRSALDVYRRQETPELWAMAQCNLAAALTRQAELAQGMSRLDLWRQATAAYRAALEIFTREHSPASWALTQYSLANLCQRRARDSVYAGMVEDACANLRQAWRHVDCALQVYTPIADPARHRRAAQLHANILEAMAELGCSGGEGVEDV